MIYNDLNFKKPLINQEKSVQKNLVYKLNIFHTQEVTGSSPVVSTRKNPETAMVSGFLIFLQNDLFVKAWVTVVYSTDFTSVSYQCAYPQLLWQSSLHSRGNFWLLVRKPSVQPFLIALCLPNGKQQNLKKCTFSKK